MWRTWHAAFSLLAICTSVHAADAQRAPETFSLSIARQPLDGALQQLARQCDVQMIFFSRVTERLSAPTIEGDYTLAAALERLLAGSGLTFRVINPQTVEVRPLQAKPIDRSRSRKAVAVRQTQKLSDEAGGPLEEVIVVGLAEQLVATRIPTPLREIPQTISIVTAEQMRARNDVVLADVLEHAPGITMTRTRFLAQNFYSRAYGIDSFHIDGGAAVNLKNESYYLLFLGTLDLIEFDHIEILRGADGLFSGNANPGGSISLVRKRPQQTFALEFNAATGSWDDRRVAIDITGPLALDGAFRGRAAAVYSHDGYFYDIDPHEKTKIFGALEYDFTDAATLTAGVSYQWDEASGVRSGLPFYADGRDSRLPRDTSLQFDWTRYRSELGGIYLQYRQQFASEWVVKFNASGWRSEAEFAFGEFLTRLIDPVTNELNAQPNATFSASPNVHTQNMADVTVSGTLDWFGWREEVAIGADFMRFKIRSDQNGFNFFGERLGDVRAFDPDDYPDPRLTRPPQYETARTSTRDEYGIFVALRVYFDTAWSIVGGARLSRDSIDSQTTTGVAIRRVTLAGYGTDQVVTPYAGLMYAFDQHYSLYASYADIYRAQINLPERAPGKLLEPVRGVNVEAGIKGEWRNGALNGSLALYRIEQSNLPGFRWLSQAEDDPDPRVPICCYTGASSKSRGVDVELSGEVTPRWILSAGYTYNENDRPQGGALSTFTPKHLLKAWTNVTLPGAFNRWQIGGGLHAQSETTFRASYCPFSRFPCVPVDGVQPAYAVLDLRAGFDVDRNWRIALTVNNVLDKTYYESISALPFLSWYGEPRNWVLRVDGRY